MPNIPLSALSMGDKIDQVLDVGDKSDTFPEQENTKCRSKQIYWEISVRIGPFIQAFYVVHNH